MIARAEGRGKQANLAMDWLRQTVAADYKYADLDPLREREDFKKLIAGLEANVNKKAKTNP